VPVFTVATLVSLTLIAHAAQFLGLAEAVGVAINSECERYEAGGVIVLVCMIFFYGFVFWMFLHAAFFSPKKRFSEMVHLSNATNNTQHVSTTSKAHRFCIFMQIRTHGRKSRLLLVMSDGSDLL
jgi:hypothetical protein